MRLSKADDFNVAREIVLHEFELVVYTELLGQEALEVTPEEIRQVEGPEFDVGERGQCAQSCVGPVAVRTDRLLGSGARH